MCLSWDGCGVELAGSEWRSLPEAPNLTRLICSDDLQLVLGSASHRSLPMTAP